MVAAVRDAGRLARLAEARADAHAPASGPTLRGRVGRYIGVALVGVVVLCAARKFYGDGPDGRRPPRGLFTTELWALPHEDGISAGHGHDPVLFDKFGDKFNLSDHNHEDEEEHPSHEGGHGSGSHGYLALAFMFGSVSWGCVLQVFQERYMPGVPYTAMLFICGLALAAVHELRPQGHWSQWDSFFISVDMWAQVDPHLIFYIFLPALVFAEAMRLNVKLAEKLLAQVLLLACPGVLMGTFMTAAFAKYVMPYGWDWATSLVFGSIMAATDPVAVVALFNTLGVSPRLTMLISGESLLNDGTAIVCFSLVLKLMLGAEITKEDVGIFAAWMIVVAILLGVALATVGLLVIELCAETKFHSDAMIQVAVTITTAFLCFFLAEVEFATSGVITVVSAGYMFSYVAWPRFVSRETMHIVWEAIEFFGNTIIFVLGGLLFGHRCLTRGLHLDLMDLGWLFALYAAVTVIRGVMILVLWPLMNFCGEPITWKEALVMTWSGLRGAVGLVLAIIVDLELSVRDPETGSLVMFHVGGIAMLTIMVNATLCAPLLRSLGLCDSGSVDERIHYHLEEKCVQAAREELERVQKSGEDVRFQNVDAAKLGAMFPRLFSNDPPGHGGGVTEVEQLGKKPPQMGVLKRQKKEEESLLPGAGGPGGGEAELRAYREMFMRGVMQAYWEDLEAGIISRTSRVARVLLCSASEGLLSTDKPLNDWEVVVSQICGLRASPRMNKIVSCCWPLNRIRDLQQLFPTEDSVHMSQVYGAIEYWEAHRKARTEILENLTSAQISEAVQKQVAAESEKLEGRAKSYLQQLEEDVPEVVERCKCRMLAGKLLHIQHSKVAELTAKGLLDDKGASHILHDIASKFREVATKGEQFSALPLKGSASKRFF